MDKPLEIAMEEFKNELYNIINTSKIPYGVMRLLLESILVEFDAKYQHYIIKLKEDYNKALNIEDSIG